MNNYSICVAEFLSLNTSALVSEKPEKRYSILSDILPCDVTGLLLLRGACITSNETAGLMEVGTCIYTYNDVNENVNSTYAQVPKNSAEFNDFTCGIYNRTGTLCGKCKDDHYPLAYAFSVNCVKCSNGTNWWKFVLAAFVPLTVFYFLILFFRINITSSYLQGFVLYNQVLSMPLIARTFLIATRKSFYHNLYAIGGSLFGIWNLDFLRFFNLDICLEISSLQIIVLDIAVGVYPILLMILTYLLINLYDRNMKPFVYIWKPFQAGLSILSSNLNIRTSLIDGFATFFLLSNVKFLSVSFDLLAPVLVYQINSTGHLTHSWRLYNDATVPYFGETHLPYGILGVSIVILLVLLPSLLLILYPLRWFQKFLNLFPFRWYILHTFMDTFQGCYKDGSEPGTRDYRWFAFILFLLRFLLISIGLISFESDYLIIASFVILLTALFLVQFQPYRENFKNLNSITITFCLLLAAVHICALEEFRRLAFLGILISLLYVMILILHWIYSHRNCGLEWFRRAKARLAGYKILAI